MSVEASPANNMKEVALGQRLLILAIVLNIVTYIVSQRVVLIIGLLMGLLVLAVAIVGVLKVTGALGFSTPRKVIYIVGLFIPVVALIVLAAVSAEATKALRANGHKVGFFGAKGV